MSEPAIRAQGLRKEFIIHKHQATTLKEMAVRNLFAAGEKVPLVALDDVSFQLERGHSLAIIGGNGSGKSTLLKLIAGLSQPTAGTLQTRGRIAALLELGAGFEPEFTGMENIFLQCSILGLSREEILARLDRILDFCQLDKFIHTPVKRYSSGMYVRLGFAIAAHVDADILLLDEVLAVGDAAFQLRCMRKIKDLRESGKSILFVSHALEHIEAIADQVLWLDHGRVVDFGTAHAILPRFYESLTSEDKSDSREVEMTGRAAAALPTGRFAATRARFTRIEFTGEDRQPRRSFSNQEAIRLEAEVRVMEPLERLELSFAFGTMDGLRAVWVGSGKLLRDVEPGDYRLEATVADHHLLAGRYLVSFMLGDPEDLKVTYDLHLRLYAVSLHDADGRFHHDVDEGRLQPLGCFSVRG